jgi:hypothetical protein
MLHQSDEKARRSGAYAGQKARIMVLLAHTLGGESFMRRSNGEAA